MSQFRDDFLYNPFPRCFDAKSTTHFYDKNGKRAPCKIALDKTPNLSTSLPTNKPSIKRYGNSFVWRYPHYFRILVGTCPVPFPPFESTARALSNLRLVSSFFIGAIDRLTIWLQFQDDMDYCTVASGWKIDVGNVCIKVAKWLPAINSPLQSPFVACWIIFQELHDFDFNPFEIMEMARRFGRPLLAKEITPAKSVRVLVEVNVSLKHYAYIRWFTKKGDPRKIKVFMERVPPYCFHCNCLGHSSDSCGFIKRKGENKDTSSPEHVGDNI